MRHTLKLATDYRLAGLFDDKLTVGGAARWQSHTVSMPWNGESINVRQGSHTIYDLNMSYEINDKAELALNVNNVFDTKYYDTTGFYDTVVYGAGRSAELTLRAKF